MPSLICSGKLAQRPHSAPHEAVKPPATRSRRCRHGLVPKCNVVSRWSIDIRYGKKLDAVALMQEWITDIGQQAGLKQHNTKLLSGAVGVPESRLELEVELGSVAEVERFWAAIPAQPHRAWSQRMQNLMVDGSPRWEIYRTCEVAMGEDAANVAAPEVERGQPPPSPKALFLSATVEEAQAQPLPSSTPVNAESNKSVDGGSKANLVLDWKGDPMTINPGDNMPFF